MNRSTEKYWFALTLVSVLAQIAVGEVTFDHDVMAVLSKAGCNSGPCHGNMNGKGDFHLSLRGQDAWQDYLAITHELEGRRINRTSPIESLFLRKPTAESPHQGGQRFKVGSVEHQILLDWMGAGMQPPGDQPALVDLRVTPETAVFISPESSTSLTVIAKFANGEQRDVTRLATYEVSNFAANVSATGHVTAESFGETSIVVRYLTHQVPVQLAFVPHASFQWSQAVEQNYVDRFVLRKLKSLRINPEPECNDTQFQRRAYLDLLGLIPNVEEAQAFAKCADPEKRERLIDELLSRPEFADNWTQKWCDLLRVEEKLLDTKGVEVFHDWIRRCFADGLPLNEFARRIIEAEGSTYENPPANLYRSLRDPLHRGESMARVFLGVRLQCAKCHNHPFDQWTQDDYYSWAACFSQVDYKIIENKRKDKFDRSEFVGEQIVIRNADKSVPNARTGKTATPRLLDSQRQPVEEANQRNVSGQVADWIAGGNFAFARAQVNRIWFHLMGRGLVDPVDDFRITNPASHSDLLDALANDFLESEFDVRAIIRRIMRSKAYQRGSPIGEASELQLSNYAANHVSRLTAEQLLDAQCRFLDIPPEFNGHEVGIRAGQLPGVHKISPRRKTPTRDDRFLMLFGKPERLMSCECERADETTLSQVFLLISDTTTQQRLEAKDGRIESMLRDGRAPIQVAKALYWSALTRSPTPDEIAHLESMFSTSNGNAEIQKKTLQDLGWALMNSKEFVFRN